MRLAYLIIVTFVLPSFSLSQEHRECWEYKLATLTYVDELPVVTKEGTYLEHVVEMYAPRDVSQIPKDEMDIIGAPPRMFADSILNAWGKDGWMLIDAEQVSGSERVHLLYFRRPCSEVNGH